MGFERIKKWEMYGRIPKDTIRFLNGTGFISISQDIRKWFKTNKGKVSLLSHALLFLDREKSILRIEKTNDEIIGYRITELGISTPRTLKRIVEVGEYTGKYINKGYEFKIKLKEIK